MFYSEVRNSLKTGDIVLFSGKGRISTGIKWATGSKWSHVGMVWRLDDWDMVLLGESTTLGGAKDMVSGTYRKGVQLVAFSTRLRNYDGEVAIRALEQELNSGQLARMKERRRELHGRPYEKNMFELIRAALDVGSFAQEEDVSSLFCSEVVAEWYQAGELFNEPAGGGWASNEYKPADFGESGVVDSLVKLGPEMLLEVG